MKDISKKQLLVVLIAGMISCNKFNPQEKPNLSRISYIQFVDFTTGDPISNLQVKRWNYKDSTNGSSYLTYKDSFSTDAVGNCKFEQSEIEDYFSWNSAGYFGDYFEHTPGWRKSNIPQTSSLKLLKTDGDISYYQATLFPKIEVTIHIRQVNPIKIDSTYPAYVQLYTLAHNNDTRNEITQVFQGITVPRQSLKTNELLDIKLKGYLAKNLFNNIRFSVIEIGCCVFDDKIIKQEIINIANRTTGPPSEILVTF